MEFQNFHKNLFTNGTIIAIMITTNLVEVMMMKVRSSVSGQEWFVAGRRSVFCHVYCLYLFAGGRPAGGYGAVP